MNNADRELLREVAMGMKQLIRWNLGGDEFYERAHKDRESAVKNIEAALAAQDEPYCKNRCAPGGENCCGDIERVWCCTLLKHHLGEHIACSSSQHNLNHWPQETEPPVQETKGHRWTPQDNEELEKEPTYSQLVKRCRKLERALIRIKHHADVNALSKWVKSEAERALEENSEQ